MSPRPETRPEPRREGPAPIRRSPPRSNERVLRATLEYDGSRYRGWQSQINARTVQGVLYHAVEQALGPGVRIQGAGRTDAGVHALAQVASFHLPLTTNTPQLEEMRFQINDRLPPDIHILSLAAAPPGFHARHSAITRTYRYRISRRRTAFGKPFVWWVRDRLDLQAMARAAQHLVGRHDFSSFCENAEGHDSTLVEVSSATMEAASNPDLLIFRIVASHYLWKMVRRVVGTLVEVGTGRIGPDIVRGYLEGRSTDPAAWTAPPSGLFLESVLYPGEPPPPPVDPLRPAF